MFKGVSWHKRTGQWRADICIQKRQIALGHFNEEVAAAAAYDAAAEKYFGEFARFNLREPFAVARGE